MQIYCNDEAEAQLKQKAENAGMPYSEYVRMKCQIGEYAEKEAYCMGEFTEITEDDRGLTIEGTLNTRDEIIASYGINRDDIFNENDKGEKDE